MSGQPYRYASDAEKYRTEYMANLNLRADLDDKTLQAVKTYVSNGSLPAVSQIPDTRTTSEKLLDIQGLKTKIISDLSSIMDSSIATSLIQGLIQSPLNIDNKLIIFVAQRIPEIVKQLEKSYKYGIKGDSNDIYTFVEFINKMYSDKNNTTASVKSLMDSGYSSNKGMTNGRDLEIFWSDLDKIFQSSIIANNQQTVDILDNTRVKIINLRNWLPNDAEIAAMLNEISTGNIGLQDVEAQGIIDLTTWMTTNLPNKETLKSLANSLKTYILDNNRNNRKSEINIMLQYLNKINELIPEVPNIRKAGQVIIPNNPDDGTFLEGLSSLRDDINNFKSAIKIQKSFRGKTGRKKADTALLTREMGYVNESRNEQAEEIIKEQMKDLLEKIKNINIADRIEFGLDIPKNSPDFADKIEYYLDNLDILNPTDTDFLKFLSTTSSFIDNEIEKEQEQEQEREQEQPFLSESSFMSTFEEPRITKSDFEKPVSQISKSDFDEPMSQISKASENEFPQPTDTTKEVRKNLLQNTINDLDIKVEKLKENYDRVLNDLREQEDTVNHWLKKIEKHDIAIDSRKPNLKGDILDQDDYIAIIEQYEANSDLLERISKTKDRLIKEITAMMINIDAKKADLKEIGGSGLKKRRGRPKGSGIKIPVQDNIDHSKGIEQSLKFSPFGKYIIHNGKLRDNVISLKNIKGGNVIGLPSNKVSDKFGKVMKTIIGGGLPSFNDMDSLTENEKKYLYTISSKANIIDKLNIPTPSKDQEEKDLHLFEVYKGEVMAGNDSKELIQKFKALLLKLSRTGVLPKQQVNEILNEILQLGY